MRALALLACLSACGDDPPFHLRIEWDMPAQVLYEETFASYDAAQDVGTVVVRVNLAREVIVVDVPTSQCRSCVGAPTEAYVRLSNTFTFGPISSSGCTGTDGAHHFGGIDGTTHGDCRD